MQLLPLIAWVINTTLSLALPRGVTLYEAWFGRSPLMTLEQYKESTRRARAANESNAQVIAKGGEGEQEGFVNKGVKEDKELKLVILLELSKRVAKHIKK
jgi:hypothetical protein